MHGSVAHAEAEVEATSADLVDVRRGLRHRRRVAEVDRLDRRPEPDRRGDVRQGGAQPERVPEARAVDARKAPLLDLGRHLEGAAAFARHRGEGHGRHRHRVVLLSDWAVRLGVWHLAAVQISKAGVIAALGLAARGVRQAPATPPIRRRTGICPASSDGVRRPRTRPARVCAGAVVSPAPATSAATNRARRSRMSSRGRIPWESWSSPTATCRSPSSTRRSKGRRWASRPPRTTSGSGCRLTRRPRSPDSHDLQMSAYTGLPPADPDGGPYPLVLFSHGFAGYRLQSTFLTTHLASWGFVVAAVEHPYRNLTAVFGDLGPLVGGLGTPQFGHCRHQRRSGEYQDRRGHRDPPRA